MICRQSLSRHIYIWNTHILIYFQEIKFAKDVAIWASFFALSLRGKLKQKIGESESFFTALTPPDDLLSENNIRMLYPDMSTCE
jgi:hypothetical protein